jgi:arylsulfatase A-like enzyme
VKPPAEASSEPGGRHALATNVDAAPTLVDYAGIERVPGSWQGRSLRAVLEDPDADWRDRIVVDHGLYTAQRAVRTDRWKFVRTYNDGEWDLPDRALYEMDADPWEQADVADDHPEVVDELEREMAAWAEAHVGREGDELREVARKGPAGLWLYG